MKSSATSERPRGEDSAPGKNKPNGWVKLTRVIIYALGIIGGVAGASLIKTSSLSSAYANGTSVADAANGGALFAISLVMLFGNIIWGTLRWFLRGHQQKWRPGQIVGKLIGGGLWRTAAILPVVIFALFFVTPKISDAISGNIHAGDKSAPVAIPDVYDELLYIDQHLDELSPEEINRKLGGLFLTNVRIAPDASGNVSRAAENPLVPNVSAYSNTVTTLNKAKLSDAGHFVVFYTDNGDDAISDAKAEELAQMMEQIIQGYQNNLGLDYEYKFVRNNVYSTIQMHMVLTNSGIDKNIMDTAMPVYVVNPYSEEENILATYAGIKFHELELNVLIHLASWLVGDDSALYASSPGYPFVNILPEYVNSENLPIVVAHELGHHYVANYSYNNYGQAGSNDDFTDETTPNWMAINVLPTQPIENLINSSHYNKGYLGESTMETISLVSTYYDFDGYPAVAFLQNYADNVMGARDKILEAAHRGDALNYLYSQATAAEFTKVMVSLAEKNLTGDYGGKLYNYTLPKGEELACVDFCTENYFINPAATEYLYFSTSEYRDARIEFLGDELTRASVLGRDYDGYWHVLSSGQEHNEYAMDEDTLTNYELIAFAVANTGIESEKSYQIKIAAGPLEDLTTEAEEGGCEEIDLDSLLNGLTQVIDAGSELVGVAVELGETLDPETDFSGVQEEYDQASTEAKSQIASAGEEISNYKITICESRVTSGQSFATIRDQLKAAMGYNFDIFSDDSDTGHVEAFAGIDLLARRGQIYILGEESGEMGLVTISITER